MTCPKCNRKTKVIDSRTDEDSTDRRRECTLCGYRFTTVEVDKDLFERMVRHNERETIALPFLWRQSCDFPTPRRFKISGDVYGGLH